MVILFHAQLAQTLIEDAKILLDLYQKTKTLDLLKVAEDLLTYASIELEYCSQQELFSTPIPTTDFPFHPGEEDLTGWKS
jgi:hypothetical protein